MQARSTRSLLLLFLTFIHRPLRIFSATCRNVPGDPGFPSEAEWSALNTSVSGRLVPVIPSAEYCKINTLTDAQCQSSTFRIAHIPGAMDFVNWEQDYDSSPPSLCLQNGTTCNQGKVSLFAILAESADDIQKGVQFAQSYSLRLAVKASGHDLLGRSTAKSSLLIHTHKLQNIEFVDSFMVGGKSKGTAVTVGSGVSLSRLYNATLDKGKIFVGGTAATVVAAGGYVQGGGHSVLSPLYGLAADNCLGFNVVIADGSVVRANEAENPDLFWALRGGGAGSWGVIVNATFQTYPTFNASFSQVDISVSDLAMLGNVTTIHAKHIFDWDTLHAGQYFTVTGDATQKTMSVTTIFPNASTSDASNAIQPFVNDIKALGANVTSQPIFSYNFNAAIVVQDDIAGGNVVAGSRLVPASVYRDSPDLIGETYIQLLNTGVTSITGLLVAGKVAENANIASAVIPQWRAAKTHVIVGTGWNDTASVAEVRGFETMFRDHQVSIMDKIAGDNPGSYSNEADALERDFRHVFYGPNYGRLSTIKRKYDPNDLFIVGAGVGSERWDRLGLCKVSGLSGEQVDV